MICHLRVIIDFLFYGCHGLKHGFYPLTRHLTKLFGDLIITLGTSARLFLLGNVFVVGDMDTRLKTVNALC